MTRLLLIQGTTATLFDGAQQVQQWDTQDPQHPVDAQYYAELEPMVFNEDWLQAMTDVGRRFSTKAPSVA